MNIVCFYGSLKYYNMKLIKDSLLKELKNRGHSITLIDKNFSSCINCGKCLDTKECALKDGFPSSFLDSCDAIIIMSPIYFFGINSKSKAFLERLYSINLEGKILTFITTSGSPTRSNSCGFNLIVKIQKKISKYCGSIYVKSINIVTRDTKLSSIPTKKLKKFIINLERHYNG